MAAVATMPVKETWTPPQVAGAGGVQAMQVAVGEHVVQAPAAVGMAAVEEHAEWPLLARLPMLLTASVRVPGFRVSDLLNLKAGSVVKSDWPCADDVELRIGSVQLSWSEFEVVEQRMAIRLTRLA